MKRIIFLLLTVLSLSAGAQDYNNEWIDYSKTYYKFKIAVTGIYRIPQSALANIGLDAVNANDFQLWRNGKEVTIYTSVQNAPINAGGYIEFWGEMNDGKADIPMYREADFQLSDKWSLQTDTAAYFLTVNPGGSNQHYIITANNVASNTLPVEPFFIHTAGVYYKTRIHSGHSEVVGKSFTYSSSYDEGEGYSSLDIAGGGAQIANVTALFPYMGAGAPDPIVNVNAAGNATNTRKFRVSINGDSVFGVTMDYYQYAKGTATFPVSKISGGSASIEVKNLSTAANDRMVVANAELVYPRQFNFGNQRLFYFELPANLNGNYLEIGGFGHAGTKPVLYDMTNGRRYEGVFATSGAASLVRFALQPSAVQRKLALVHQSTLLIPTITSFQQRNFINYGLSAYQGDYLIISHPSLTCAVGGDDPVEDYRQYRTSPQGGGYNAKVYMIDQLEDQFGLGIKQHPLSVRNFVRWARKSFSTKIKYIFIIGKGVIYVHYRTNEKNPDMEKLALVPTFGFPASDNLLSAEGNSSVPLTPIGRISVINKSEISAYLEKVKEYEANQNVSSPSIAEKAWMKNVVHVTGASDNNTSDILLEALNGHKKIVEDSLYAGYVNTFTKTSADAVQQVSSVRMENLFREGIGLLTYFGHSSASTLEFNLDNPQNYDNDGKYPVFIVMGCNAGSFYNFNEGRLFTKETISEKFVLAENRGAIAFLASTHLGIVHYLDIYNSKFYKAMSTTHYGSTIGEIMKETIKQVFAATSENDFYARFQCEQFTLHGDPALKMYSFDKPDYVIEEPQVKITPAFIPVSNGSFKINVTYMNIGKAVNKDIVIEIKRRFPDLTTEVVLKDTVRFTKFMDSIVIEPQIIPTRDRGKNEFIVTLDLGNNVDELYETNNTITKEVYIIEDDIKPVYPYNYSIVNTQDIKLVASSADPFATMHEYRLEMDTTALFNSPWKITRTVNSKGGVFEVSPGVTFIDSTVYYWRVSVAVTSGEPLWNTFSFQYIANGGSGFSQAHYYQHLQSHTSRIKLDTTRQWNYVPVTNNLFVANGVWLSAITQESQLVVNVNDSSYIRNICNYGFTFNVFDKNTFKPWRNQVVSASSGLYGSGYPGCVDGESRVHNFEFPNTPAGRNSAMLFLKNIVPDSNFVVVRFTYKNGTAQEFVNDWKKDELTYGAGNSMYAELKKQGFAAIDSMNQPRVFNFVFKKNSQGVHAPRYVLSDGIFDGITLSVNCFTTDSVGFITSPLIGPAKEWQQLNWRGFTTDILPGDTPLIDLYGINASGSETLLMNGLNIGQQTHDISSINADQYPFVRLKMKNQDLEHYSPYQLKYWMLNYIPVPEGAIAPNIYFDSKDTANLGGTINFGIAFKNVSKEDFDSVKVKFRITDRDNVEQIAYDYRLKKLPSQDTIKLNIPINTKSLSGHNTVFVNFNPDGDQPEQYLFNNYAFRNLYVVPDSLNPVMDVTFDGTHILNKDIVSAKPKILIKLSDEIQSLPLNDTSLFTVKVRYPDNPDARRYFFNGNDTLQFIPPGQGENTASVNFAPYFPVDGEYELIITGKDKSGNVAGNVEYKVAFSVINKPMISNMLNYPNPFTTSTAFVFTVTGSEVPQNIRIQVLTITGKIVREITKEELGPLHIGRNITEFKWDGTDQYGQKLANGIYLYRVITNLNGKSLDKYKAKDDNTDQYFNKGYGKMYLMR